MHHPICVVLLGFAALSASCSDGKFSKAAGQSPSEPAAALPAAPEESSNSEGMEAAPEGSVDAPTTPSTTAQVLAPDDKAALDECAKQWVKTPFSAEQLAKPKLVEINDTVNNNGVIYADSKVTEVPTLFLVNFNISVGNNGELHFMNPKGWYCFNVKAKIINNFLIKTACDTHTAIVSKLAQNDKNFTISREAPCPAPAP